LVQGKNGETRRIPTAHLARVFEMVEASEEAELAASAVQEPCAEKVVCYDLEDFDVRLLDELASDGEA
jgi:hypothetical protein